MCTVVSPDLKMEYGNTGSAMVWEMFDSIAYDADKFNAMLDRAQKRYEYERKIIKNKNLSFQAKIDAIEDHRKKVRKLVGEEGKFQMPPKGFTLKKALDLFEKTGDYKKK